MQPQRLSCPHCKAVIQLDTANAPAQFRCPQCKGAVRLPAGAIAAGWYYARNKQKLGPVPLTALRELAVSGKLAVSDMVMQAGSTKWQSAGALPGLFTPRAAEPSRPAAPGNTNGGPPPPLPKGWFYLQGKKKVGPVPLETMLQLLAFGMIRPTDLILAEGSPKWQLANSHPALCPPAPEKPPSTDGNGITAEAPPIRWYYAQNKAKHGPVCREFLQQLANDGELTRTDMVLAEGTVKWIKAEELAGLFPAVLPAPPIAPTPPAPQTAPTPPVESVVVAAPPAPVAAQVAALKSPFSPVAPPAPRVEADDDEDSVFPESRPIPAPPPVPPPPPVPLAEDENPENIFLAPSAPPPSILADDTARPKLPRTDDSFIPDFSDFEQAPSAVAEDTARPRSASVFDSFIGNIVSEKPLPPTPKPRLRPSSTDACPHCNGTAYCGRRWDSAGIMEESGPPCDRCAEKSGLPHGEKGKVACSFCQGKGFAPQDQDSGSWSSEAVAWRLRGLACSDSGDYDQAVSAFTEALELEPDFADAYYDRGWAFLAAGRTEEGEADLAEAARLSEKYRTGAEASDTPKSSGFGLFGWFVRKGRDAKGKREA